MAENMSARQLPHGGDWYGYQTEYDQEPLDYSVNINPLGMPESVREAIARAAQKADRYPDPLCRRLTKAIGEAEHVCPDWILCGNGAADLIFRLSAAVCREKAMKCVGGDYHTVTKAIDTQSVHSIIRALIPAPSFSEYESAVRTFGGAVTYYPLNPADGFHIREDFPDMITDETDLVFLCQPNNPTGVTIKRELIERILMRCVQTQTRLVVDECFIEFLDAPDAFTMKAFLAEHPNLILLKAFTKSYAMAGVRLGYVLCSDEGFLADMRACGQPWAVSILAEEAGLAALKEDAYLVRMRRIVREERQFLKEGLQNLGFHVVDGEANFILFQLPQGDSISEETAEGFREAMKKQGILIRSCANYPGLSEGWFRIAVRTRADNVKLIQALRYSV